MMTQNEIMDIFKKVGAMLEGHFLLSSGLHSSAYLQCALVLEDPKLAERLCSELASMFKGEKPDVVIAPAIGGIIVSYEVARALGVKGFFTERVDGNMCLRRGFSINKGSKVLVVEDVITTGLSTKEVIDVVKKSGATLIGVGCIVNRSKEKIDFGAPAKCLINLDIPVFKPDQCSLCAKKIPITRPGSRKR